MKIKTIFPYFLACAVPFGTWAAEDDSEEEDGAFPPGPLEEVVVSEFRRSSSLEIDSSITVLNSAVIEAASTQHFQELISLVPNMNWSGDGSRARYFQLRGIGELEQYEGAPNPSVGFVIDDIDLSGVGGIGSVFDIQQVDVLRGPQATRFGASALAGLVYVQSHDPGRETGVDAELLLGNDNTLSAGVAAGGGLTDALSGRFSIQQYRSNGFYDNVYLGRDDTNERDELTARGKLLWEFATDWEAKLSLLYADFDNGYDAWSPENGRTTFSNQPGRDEQETFGTSLRISGPAGRVAEFVSITGYADSDILFSYDGEWGNPDYWAPYGYDYIYADERVRQSLTQELRLVSSPGGSLFDGNTDWVVGLYMQRLEETDDIVSSGRYDDSADAPWSWCAPCLDQTTLESDYEATNLAVFGRLDSALSRRLSLDLGLRLERWDANYTDAFTDWIYGNPDQPLANDFEPAENLWGGDVSLDYAWRNGVSLYGTISRGYKAGGFNPSLARALGPDAALGVDAVAYDPETLLNYEAGLKGLWLDGTLNAEISLFYMDRGDMQLRSSVQFTNNPNDFIFVTSNAEGHAYGLEASMDWQVADNWRLHGSLGLLESEIDTYPLEREADIEGELEGRNFAHAPPYTLNIGASYANASGWFGRLDVNAVGSFYYDYSHDEKSGSYQLVNLRLGKEWGRWALSGWVRNLFDESYHVRGFSFGLEPPAFPRATFTRLGDPRHCGLTLRYQY